MARPNILLFNVEPKTIDKGGKVVFAWSVANADTITLTIKGSVSAVGSWTFYPASTRTYTLTAKSGIFTVKKSLTVTVIQPPPEPPPEPPPPEPPPLPPTPAECPDFWVDPVGAVLCWILTSIEAALGMVSGGFLSFITFLQQWSAAFTVDFWYFLQDPISSIKTWMSDVFVTIQNLTNQITTGITDWWNQTVIDVGVMITNATTGFKSWIDERFTGINDWWTDAQTVWGTFWNERISGVESWINEFSKNVSNWYNANVLPIIDTIRSNIDDAANWIKGFPTLLATWWNDRVVDIGIWLADATTAANDWINGFPDLIGTWWNDRVIEIGVWLADRDAEFNYWVENTLPGIVEDMFKLPEWLTGPLTAIGKFAQAIIDMLAGTYPKEKPIQDAEDKIKTHQTEIKRIINEL